MCDDYPAPWVAFGAGNHVPTQCDPESFSRLVRSWTQDCDQIHPACKQATVSKLPTCILQVNDAMNNMGSQITVRLIETCGQIGKYVTLGHCWGTSERPLKTTKDTLEKRKSGIPRLRLPRIFHDAITMTMLLGFQFVWIDSLCIIQDQESDWEEAAKMIDVYSNSSINIAATSSPDSDGGCFSPRGKARWDDDSK